MAYKILTKNGIDNSNIDGARGEFFNSGMRSGIVQGALNEGTFIATSSNTISLDTCELRIAGHRVVIDAPITHTFSNAPSSNTRYSFIAQIIVGDNQSVEFSILVQSAETTLIQNDLYKKTSGQGTYQIEIGKLTLTSSLTIEDVVRTIDVITGGSGNGSCSINVGNVITEKIQPNLDAEVDIDTRYEEDEGKEYLDFKFYFPLGNIESEVIIEINGSSGTITQEQATALEQDNVIVTRTYGSFTDIYKKWYTYTDGKSIVYYVPSNTGSISYVTFNTNLLTYKTSTSYVKNTGIYGTETAGQVLTSDGNNGTEWTTLEVSGGVTSIGGVTGDITLGNGLSIENNQLSATATGGVTSISGVTGNILLGENLSITDNILYVDIAKYVTATEEQINSIFEEEN